MQKLSKLICTLDNCDKVEISEENIMALEIDNIRESKVLIPRKGLKVTNTAEEIYIVLHNKGDRENTPYKTLDCCCGCGTGSKCGSECNCSSSKEPKTVYNLLKNYGLVSIELFLEGEETGEKVFTDYEEGEGCINNYQTSYINEFGDLFIVISRKSKVEDRVSKEDINDKEYLNYFFYETYNN